jgi:aromatic ring-cleaving dioxygenase
MNVKRQILSVGNLIAHRVGLHVLPLHQYRNMQSNYYGPKWDPPTLPEEARSYLTLDNPRLLEIKRRYEGHPASVHSQWSEESLLQQLQLTALRDENHYVYQVRYSPTAETYYVTAYYVRDHDRLGLFGRLTEDGLFGAYTLPFENGYVISRDLLSSINEINFIYRMLGRKADDPVRLFDIGAGYGRLAHRLTEGLAAATAVCTDAVPISTFLSEFYLRYRAADRARVLLLDEVDSLVNQKFDAIVNIHSFSECRLSVIAWWMKAVDRMDVARMLIIPNARDQLLSTESDGTHKDFSRLIEESGWRLAHKEPIYALSDVALKSAHYPNFCFHWFERG